MAMNIVKTFVVAGVMSLLLVELADSDPIDHTQQTQVIRIADRAGPVLTF